MPDFHRDGFTVSTDRDRLDLDVIHGYLSRSYWAEGVSREIVARSVEHSHPFGLYEESRQIGFARAITDYATFAYVADVFVLEPWRGRGLAKWLVECMLACPELEGLRRWMLATNDAHGLYAQYGFAPLAFPERFMEHRPPIAYGSPQF